VIGRGAGGEGDASNSDSSDKRHYHDLQVGRTVRGMDRVVHGSLPAALGRPLLGVFLRPDCFKPASWVPQNGFVTVSSPCRGGSPRQAAEGPPAAQSERAAPFWGPPARKA